MPLFPAPNAFLMPGDVESARDVPGVLATSFSPLITDGTLGTPSAGTVYAGRLWVPRTCSVSNIEVYVGGAGATVANAQLGIFNGSDGTLGAVIGVTATQSTNLQSTGRKSLALASGPFTVIGGPGKWVYGALVVGSAGTMPTFGRVTAGNAGFMSGDLASEFRYSTTDTGRTTTLLPTTLGARTASNLAIWMRLT